MELMEDCQPGEVGCQRGMVDESAVVLESFSSMPLQQESDCETWKQIMPSFFRVIRRCDGEHAVVHELPFNGSRGC